jgi:hypothetical protein
MLVVHLQALSSLITIAVCEFYPNYENVLSPQLCKNTCQWLTNCQRFVPGISVFPGNKMVWKTKTATPIRTVSQSNVKIVEISKIHTPNTHVYDHLSGTKYQIFNKMIKLFMTYFQTFCIYNFRDNNGADRDNFKRIYYTYQRIKGDDSNQTSFWAPTLLTDSFYDTKKLFIYALNYVFFFIYYIMFYLRHLFFVVCNYCVCLF